jgi:uncharacterized protein
MVYEDRIYGEIKIEESALLELIRTKEIQRLKSIDQAGYPPLYYNPRFLPLSEIHHTRFEHSLGVCYLLKRFGASLEEQIAGLIHDVSHSAFSHCIDYVLASGSEKEHNHQDNIFKTFTEESEIPEILKRYNFDADYVLDEKNFPLLEKLLPDLCADRIDYSLRSGIVLKEINKEALNYLLDHLTVENNSWIFKNFESAKKYAGLFLKLNTLYYAGIYSAVMFRTVGDALKYSLQKGYISEKNLYATDEEVINKIKQNLGDEKLKLLFDRMNNRIKFENNPQNYDAHGFCKSRIVNPLFKENGEIKKISEADSKWKEIVEKEMKPKEYFIKFEK